MKGIQQRARFSLIRYANCWEDADTLLKASENKGGVFISVASALDNSLSLLTLNPDRVLAADISPAQTALCHLKKVAFEELGYAELLEFLGVRESPERERVFNSLKGKLPVAATEYFERNMSYIRTGLIHSGKFEKYFSLFRKYFAPVMMGEKRLNSLLEEKSIDERLRFYDTELDGLRWRFVFRIFFSRFFMARMGRDPEFFRYVKGSVSSRILERVRIGLTIPPNHENPYLRYILKGSFENCLPHYLREESFSKIKENISRMEIFRGTVEEAADLYSGKIGLLNLSDIFEYMDEGEARACMNKLLQNTAVHGRFVYWNMLADRNCELLNVSAMRKLRSLEKGLFEQDKAFFYSALCIEEKL